CNGQVDDGATGPCGACCPPGQACLGDPPMCAATCCSTKVCWEGQVCGVPPGDTHAFCVETEAGARQPVVGLCMTNENASCQSNICVNTICREACCADGDCRTDETCTDFA